MKTGQTNQQTAFIRTDLVVVIGVVILFSIIFSYRLMRQHTINRRYACLDNLRLVDDLKGQWALENKKPDSAVPAATDLPAYLGRAYWNRPYIESNCLPYCPDDPLKKFTNSYSPNSVANLATCKIAPLWHVLQTNAPPTNHSMDALKKIGRGVVW